MAKGIFGSFSDIASATNTDPVDVSHLETIYAAGTGTFVGTWALQFTMDDLAGSPNWHTHPTITGKTAAFNAEVGFRCRGIRLIFTAWTSGTLEGSYSGDDTDLKG